MNLYFLVEGQRTEIKIYRRWLEHLLPNFTRVDSPDEAAGNNYFLVSGMGYPRLLDEGLPASIADVNSFGHYDYLIVCLDADEFTVEEREAEVQESLDNQNPKLNDSTTFRIIVQNRCMETWCLGNRAICPNNPHSARLQEFTNFYNVRLEDPEKMGTHPDYELHAEFHLHYLREIFNERNLTYSKKNPGDACEPHYLEELQKRVQDCPDHLNSLQTFFQLCTNVYDLTSPPSSDTDEDESA